MKPELSISSGKKETTELLKFDEEGKEAAAGTVLKRKRGRPSKSQGKRPNTPLAVDHQNGDAVAVTGNEQLQLTGSPNSPQQKNTLVVNDVENLPNTSAGKTSSVQLEKYQSVKGKRSKRHKIRSITVVSPAQGGQASLSKQKENEGLMIESLEVPVEKSLDTNSISDDETLENQIEDVKSPWAVTSGQNLSFEKRSTLWATLESTELFQMIPQNPHFGPLENEKEFTRETQAISKMVTYFCVVEATSKLKLENPRSTFEDNLGALVELESHGFDVKAVRDCLTGLLRIKDNLELLRLEEQSRKVKDKMEVERVERQRIDTEIEVMDKQVVALLEKRAEVLKKKEKKDAEVSALEAEADDINEVMSKVRCKFHGLAASLSVSKQQTPTA